MPQTVIEPAFDSPDIFFKFVEPQDIHLGTNFRILDNFYYFANSKYKLYCLTMLNYSEFCHIMLLSYGGGATLWRIISCFWTS
jgi:hypothetical protein